MSFAWSDFLDLARQLHSTTTPGAPLEEAQLRTAISRAYYAAHCEAREISELLALVDLGRRRCDGLLQYP